jgi:Holliday junction resolvase RusA-like endonuclease
VGRSLTILVRGDPVPQPRQRISARGGIARAYIRASHPVHEFRRQIADACLRSAWPDGPSPAPFFVSAEFVFRRPKSHLRANGELRASAPAMISRDIDNLLKAALDGITDSRAVWDDDRQVVELRQVRKSWGLTGQTVVTMGELP